MIRDGFWFQKLKPRGEKDNVKRGLGKKKDTESIRDIPRPPMRDKAPSNITKQKVARLR